MHKLKAVDGQERKEEITNRPYEPQKANPSPAQKKAKEEKRIYHHAEKDKLWEELELEAGCLATKNPPCECFKHLIEIEGGVDYCIIMAFLDNHSGGRHGTGHAGALIIDGESYMGTYTDITQHEYPILNSKGEVKQKTLGIVNVYPLSDPLLNVDLKLDETALGKAYSEINKEYGSGIVSAKACQVSSANGPDHQGYSRGWSKTPAGFMVNGIIAWAAYALPSGAYKKMLAYANKKEQEVAATRSGGENAYSLSSFNCMTYAIAVLDVGKGHIDRHPGKMFSMDHPNDHIKGYMQDGNDDSIFDDRMHQGAPEAVSQQSLQSTIPGIRQRTRVNWVNSLERDLVVHHPH